MQRAQDSISLRLSSIYVPGQGVSFDEEGSLHCHLLCALSLKPLRTNHVLAAIYNNSPRIFRHSAQKPCTPLHAERKGLISLLAAKIPGLPAQSVQQPPVEASVPVMVETTHPSRSPRASSAAVAAVADIGAREIFAQSFELDQEQLEESL